MAKRRATTYSELKAKRLAGVKRKPERVDIPSTFKWIGGLVIVITSFFASTLVVLLAYQYPGIEASSTATAAGRIAILVLGVAFPIAGILVVRRQAASASSWLGKRLVTLGMGPEGKKREGASGSVRRRRPPSGRR